MATRLPRTPLLIAVTGYGTLEVQERARKAGFRHVLVKPADPFELDHLIAAHAGDRPGGSAY